MVSVWHGLLLFYHIYKTFKEQNKTLVLTVHTLPNASAIYSTNKHTDLDKHEIFDAASKIFCKYSQGDSITKVLCFK